MATELPELTDEHKRWVTALEEDFPRLPLGYARAMVEHYLMEPGFYEPENVERLAKLPPPDPPGPRTDGKAELLTPEAADELFSRLAGQLGIESKSEK